MNSVCDVREIKKRKRDGKKRKEKIGRDV